MHRTVCLNDHPGYPFAGKSPVGACHRGGTFEPIGVPAGYLSGVPRDAMEGTFNARRRGGESCENPRNSRRIAPPVWSTIVRTMPIFFACRIRLMCDLTLNRPATPLYDAHQGGCFISKRGGGA